MKRAAIPALLLISGAAYAEGELGPMFGGSAIGTRTPDQPEVAGVQLEVAFWRGRIGAAIEGTQQWGFDPSNPVRVTTVGGSARLLVYRSLMPSLLEPRDVEFGVELHGIVERAWWSQEMSDPAAPVRYGAGVTVRLRGGSDDQSSNLLAESRFFVRVMTSRTERTEVAARDMTAPVERGRDRELGVVIGLGASWGGGQRPYIDRFRPRPLDTFVDTHLIH
jgi:hypothetical protein